MSARGLGRNDPCRCGSGKKYKKCCLLPSLPRSSRFTVDPVLPQVTYTARPTAPIPKPIPTGPVIRDGPGRTIGTTAEHPFYVYGRGWTPLAEIRSGEWIRTDEGWVEVQGIEDTGRVETVYNLEVEEDHTYFVGGREWGFAIWAHNEYSPGVEEALRQRLQAAGLDHDAINVIVKAGKRADVPAALGDQWAARWNGQALQDMVNLSPGDRQHALARHVDEFLQDPANRLLRANHAASQMRDADLRTAGQLAVDLHDVLTAFGHDVNVPTTSPFTGKVKYLPLTDLDVATNKAIVEVTTQHDASGKVAQLAVLRGIEANPHGLPVFHLLPNVNPTSLPAQALRAAGSAGVYNDRAALVAAIRALP